MSTFNSCNLEQNSEILFNLVDGLEYNRSNLKTEKLTSLLVKIVYDEWNELYDFFDYCSNRISSMNMTVDVEKFNEIFQIRLKSRYNGFQALKRLIFSSIESQSQQEVKMKEIFCELTIYNDNLLAYLINQLNISTTKSDMVNFSFDLNPLDQLLDDLMKRSFDSQQFNILIKLGVEHSLCETIEIIWYYLYKMSSQRDTKNLRDKVTFKMIIILSNALISSRNTSNTIYTRRLTKQALLNILKISFENQETRDENEKVECELFKAITSVLNILSNKKYANENFLKAFIKPIVKCVLSYDHLTEEDLNFKHSINTLLNISLLSIQIKRNICQVKGLLKHLIHLIDANLNETALQIIISLLRSLVIFCSMDENYLQELRDQNFYSLIANRLLKSSDLAVVAQTCCILWTITNTSKKDCSILFELNFQVALKPLTYSSNTLISQACVSILKNLYSAFEDDNLNETFDLRAQSDGLHRSKNTLFDRTRKQIVNDSNEFMRLVTNRISFGKKKSLNESELESTDSLSNDGSPSLSTHSSCSLSLDSPSSDSEISKKKQSSIKARKTKHSYYLNASSHSNSSISSNCSSHYENINQTSKKESYLNYINNRHLRNARFSSSSSRDNNSFKNVKHVQFKGEQIIEFNNSNDSIKNQDTLDIEIIDLEDSAYTWENSSWPEKCLVNIRCEKRSVSPPASLRFLKSNSILLKQINSNQFKEISSDSNSLTQESESATTNSMKNSTTYIVHSPNRLFRSNLSS
jgi:hypothetical protein